MSEPTALPGPGPAAGDDVATLQRRLERATNARKQAEQLLEQKSTQLYQQALERERDQQLLIESNARTEALNAELEQRVAQRTAELEVTNQALRIRTHEAEAANRAKADFLANMSHEIRTPMNAILGLAYLLEQKSLDSDAAGLVKKIRHAGASLLSIINDILDFSKIEAGRLDIEKAPFHPADVLDNLAAIMGANVGNKDLEIVIAPAPRIKGQLLGDAHRIEQVLINLTGNAIKFTGQGMIRVGVTLLAQDEQLATLRFAVSDTGIGIAHDVQPHLFSAFMQADTSTTRRFGGTGLGLSISRHLVEHMGGKIGVISEPGQGSEFWFTLSFEWQQVEEFAPPELAQLDVLIADDCDIARENLSLTANAVGWHATQAKSGPEAIAEIRNKLAHAGRYDVLLLDWQMPDMDGLSTALSIKHTFKHEALPVILMVTAFSRDDLLRQPNIELVDGILSKPITGSSLYNSVAEVLCRREGRAEVHLPLLHGARRGKLQRLPGLRVLVVDDSDINREVALRILSAEGAVVHLANDGQAALAWLQANPAAVEIVMMDVQMPVMDGCEATRRMRAVPALVNLPVIALTAGAFKSQQDETREAGMNAFVSKPFSVDELIAAILHLVTCPAPAAAISYGSNANNLNNAIGSITGIDEAAGGGHPLALTADDVLPDLPGLALARGLQVWQDLAVYRKFLAKFAADYQDVAKRLAAHYQGNETHAASMMAHKLKGAAGNLALPGVESCAAALETCFGQPLPLVAQLQAALDVALASIAEFVLPDAPVSQAGGGNPQLAISLLQELLSALDTDTPDRANQLLDALAPMLGLAAVEPLRQCVDDFDFRRGEELTRQLLAQPALAGSVHA